MPLYFINLLRDVVGASHVVSGEDAAPYCSDWRGRYSGVAIAVVLPNSAEQVSAVVGERYWRGSTGRQYWLKRGCCAVAKRPAGCDQLVTNG